MKVVGALIVVVAASAFAEEAKKPPSAEEQAMMEKYAKAAEPGPEHKQLAKMAGKWKLKVTSWMAPGAPSTTSDATAEYRPILGGRFLEQEVHGDMGGQPFEGRGLEGYDNIAKEYFGTWVDSMTTGPMVLKGKCTGKKCSFKGKVSDAMAGKPVAVSTAMTAKDDDNMVWEMIAPGADGKPFKVMEIVYTRQK